MKVVYKSKVLEVLDIYVINYGAFTYKGKQYENDIYIAVRTENNTFEINGKSKPFNIIIDNLSLKPEEYLNRLCKYSGKLKLLFDTELEKNYFSKLIKKD